MSGSNAHTWRRSPGRDPETVDIVDLLPAIFAAVPDTSTGEIVEALRWSARKDLREADKLERGGPLLMVIVVGVLMLAFGVDLAAAIGWLARRWK